MTYTRLLLTALLAVVMTALPSHAQQLPNNGFEDGWVDCKPYTGGETTTVDVKTPKSWTIAHVAGYKFLGMWMGKTTVGEQVVGYNNSGSAVKIINSPNSVVSSQTVPGYITLGTTFNTANTSGGNKDGGSFGGINFNHRPDALSFRYQRYQVTTPATIVAYLWKGSWSQANVRVSIGSSPTKVTMTDRERNILGIETAYGDNPTSSSNAKRIATINVRLDDNNETEWKEISYKFIYETDDTPEKINVIFGAGDYFSDSPEVNNSLTIDDVKLIYYSRLEKLAVNGIDIPGFNSDTYHYVIAEEMPKNPVVTYTKLGGGQSATVTQKTNTEGDVKSIIITVTGIDNDIDDEKVHTYEIEYKPYYSRISGVKIGEKVYNVGADGQTIDATDLALPMPANSAITVNTLTGGQGKATVSAWTRDIHNSTISFTVTNSQADVDGQKSHKYTIQFKKPIVSRLKNITSIATFKDTTYTYTVRSVAPETYDELGIEYRDDWTGSQEITRADTKDGKRENISITLTAPNNGQDYDGKSSHTYVLTFNKPTDELRSTRLTSLTIKGIQIEPFDKDQFEYILNTAIPEGITLNDIQTTIYPGESDKTVSEGTYISISKYDVNKGILSILVEHPDEWPDEDGDFTHEYTIRFLPYYSRLSSITVGEDTEEMFDQTGKEIEVSFTIKMPEKESIKLTLPKKTSGEITTAVEQDKDKAITTVTVSNEKADVDGLKEHQYIISFAMPHFSRLASLSLGGKEVEGFSPNVYSYSIPTVMPETPEISAVAMTGGQGRPVVSTPRIDWEKNTITITVTNSENDIDGAKSHSYALSFLQDKSTKLRAIAIDGKALEGFEPEKREYNLTGLLPSADRITATPAVETVVPVITLNEEEATATIILTNGSRKGMYTLRFEKACPATLEGISVSGKAVTGFSPDKLTYDLEVKSMPSESGITVKLTDSRATAKVAIDAEAKQATITVTSPLAHTEAEAQRVYTLNFTISQSVTPTPTPDDGKTTYGGRLTIMMMGEDLTNGGQEARVEIENGEEGLCTFRLPDFSLDLGDGPASLGDIVVENVKVTTAADEARTYEGEVKGMELAEGAIIADVTLTGTADASGKAHMVIKVNWEGIDIDVEFNGQAEEKPEVPVTPAPADGTTIYNGMLTIMMMGEDLTKGGQEARVEIEDGEEGLCTFRLPDFSLDLGDGPASLGDIVVENVKVTTAADGSKTFEGNVEGMELAEGAIIADVTLSGTADSEGMAHMVIKVNWEGIDIDVEFNGQAEEKPEVPVTPTPGDGVWDLTEGIITVEMNGYDITEGGTPTTLHTARMDDGKYTFMVPDFMLALDADNTPANLGDIVVNGITASQLSGSLTRYTGTVDNLSLAGGSIAANASIDGTIAADGTTVINVDVEWIMEDGRHVPIMVRFTNTPRSNNTAEDESYSGVMTAEIEGEPIRTFGVLLRISPHSPGRCNMTIEGFDFSPASRAAGLGHTINIPGVCVTPLADGMTGYDGNTSGISVSAGITVDAILHGFTTETGHHSLSLDLLWAEQGVRIAGTFDGHIDVTAIDAPGSDRTDNDENAEWYNMQGIRVNGANLRPGVYIKRTATKTEKIIISE